MKVAIIYSLPSARMRSTSFSATDDDTKIIAEAVSKGLQANDIDSTILPITEDTLSKILDIRANCIFNLIEWCGHDISLASKAFYYLRLRGLPVTGNSEKLYVLTGDKAALKQALLELNLPTPPGFIFKTGKETPPSDLKYPVLVKPSLEHCSMGLSASSIAHNSASLLPIVERQIKEFEQPVIAEEFIEGRELEVYLLEANGVVRVLPIEEVIFNSPNKLAFQTYSAKWEEGSHDYQTTDVVLAKLTEEERQIIESVCKETFLKLGFRGYARFDVRFRNNTPYLLETNANPSVYDDETELVDPNKEVIWGIKFSSYVKAIVDTAFFHYQRGDQI